MLEEEYFGETRPVYFENFSVVMSAFDDDVMDFGDDDDAVRYLLALPQFRATATDTTR